MSEGARNPEQFDADGSAAPPPREDYGRVEVIMPPTGTLGRETLDQIERELNAAKSEDYVPAPESRGAAACEATGSEPRPADSLTANLACLSPDEQAMIAVTCARINRDTIISQQTRIRELEERLMRACAAYGDEIKRRLIAERIVFLWEELAKGVYVCGYDGQSCENTRFVDHLETGDWYDDAPRALQMQYDEWAKLSGKPAKGGK